MKTYTKEEIEINFEDIANMIEEGALFIYPTDTIYGIGCNALDEEAVNKLRELKQRPNEPLSVIAPSKEWIEANCDIKDNKWMDKLPGPYTLVLNLNNKGAVAPNINPKKDTLGVRIPNHWITGFVQGIGFPIITTSANISGEYFMTSMDNLSGRIKAGVRFIIYDGELNGKPSKIVDLSGEEASFKER